MKCGWNLTWLIFFYLEIGNGDMRMIILCDNKSEMVLIRIFQSKNDEPIIRIGEKSPYIKYLINLALQPHKLKYHPHIYYRLQIFYFSL